MLYPQNEKAEMESLANHQASCIGEREKPIMKGQLSWMINDC